MALKKKKKVYCRNLELSSFFKEKRHEIVVVVYESETVMISIFKLLALPHHFPVARVRVFGCFRIVMSFVLRLELD